MKKAQILAMEKLIKLILGAVVFLLIILYPATLYASYMRGPDASIKQYTTSLGEEANMLLSDISSKQAGTQETIMPFKMTQGYFIQGFSNNNPECNKDSSCICIVSSSEKTYECQNFLNAKLTPFIYPSSGSSTADEIINVRIIARKENPSADAKTNLEIAFIQLKPEETTGQNTPINNIISDIKPNSRVPFGDLKSSSRSQTEPEQLKKLLKRVILHHTGSSSFKGTYATLQDRGLSVHYVIDVDGSVYYLVDESKKASHAEDNNDDSIGIEIVNLGKENTPYTSAQYESIKKLITEITQRWPNIKYDDEHIIGHFQVSSSGKWDPSPNFEWARIGLPNHPTATLALLSEEDQEYYYS